MELSSSDLEKLRQIAKKAALKAGQHVIACFGTDFKIGSKNKGGSLAADVVTEVDIKSQEIIHASLQESIKKYDLGWLGEESEDDKSRLVKDYFWTVDPIDGTLPFTKKSPGFAVAIGLVSKQGDAVVGVAYDPYHNDLYDAVKGGKVYKNEKLFSIEYNKNKGLTFYSDLSFLSSGALPYLIKSLEEKSLEKYNKPLEVITHQGAVMNAMCVLQNAPAVYIKPHRDKLGGGCAWDFAASACIAEAMGCTPTDYFGNKINLNKEENTYMNNEGIKYEIW
ncbi:fructose-1,6-bisphosphatase/inositol monophosphatase family enzyme [Wenyingzhuangia heitensis]|uniref:Fructose-1,6-bisphosphatase/inositol monophosphatase family enzyme n=1 Tax=Wenyingzhuangia heitensis TaxID=1487859 RepID=A0ABX0UBV6_9FLAO|nr:inositol monophosphatase family protein [Wenyingzhuangia heitensis]NIJ45310.1 fructose-1,6-bisphosphatase/inositol monophosphatase family enzyme [Wenyingzhuangia heitensis]